MLCYDKYINKIIETVMMVSEMIKHGHLRVCVLNHTLVQNYQLWQEQMPAVPLCHQMGMGLLAVSGLLEYIVAEFCLLSLNRKH